MLKRRTQSQVAELVRWMVGHTMAECMAHTGLGASVIHHHARSHGLYLSGYSGVYELSDGHPTQKSKYAVERIKPEYENQDLLDLCVLERDEYCTKYDCSAATYYARCQCYKGHRNIPTPKVRREWAIDLEKEAG